MRRSRRGMELVAAGAVLALCLAVVSLASRSRLPAEAPADGVPVPPAVASWAYALFVLAGLVAVPVFLFVFVRETPYSARRRRRARLFPLLLVGLVGAAVLVNERLDGALADLFGRLEIAGASFRPADDRPGVAPPAPEMLPLAVVAAVALAAGGMAAAHRTVRRRPALAPRLASVLDTSLEELRADADARRAVIRAYAGMERALERGGLPRDGAEAPLEYLARVLLSLDVSPGPVERLTDLFERARFSQHAIGDDLKAEAVAALGRVREELEAAA